MDLVIIKNDTHAHTQCVIYCDYATYLRIVGGLRSSLYFVTFKYIDVHVYSKNCHFTLFPFSTLSRSGSRGPNVSIASNSKFSLSRASRAGLGSRGNLNSGHSTRKGLQSESQVKVDNALIINDKGEDITPKPLMRHVAESGIK